MSVDHPLKLEPAERLFIRRRRMNLSQRAMAAHCKVSLTRYGRMELGQDPVADGALVHSISLGTIKPHERCVLYRRRCGKTQAEVATDLGVCRFTLNQMELGEVDCTDLVCYWEA